MDEPVLKSNFRKGGESLPGFGGNADFTLSESRKSFVWSTGTTIYFNFQA